MPHYRATPTRSDRATAIAAVVAMHAAAAALVLTSQQPLPTAVERVPTVLVDIRQPPPPPPPPPPPDPGRARDEQGAAGKKAEPSPVVAPPPKLPQPSPLPAAPVAGSGNAASAGAATAGTGTGAGGSGSGRGGGGTGGGIGSEARLLSGGLSSADYRRLRAFAAPSGRARLAILVGADGRVARCSIANSSGDSALDSALCALLQPRMRWSAARDTAGNPISVGLYYVATWDRY